MKSGWYKDNNEKWYFLKSSGAMTSNEYVDGYYLDTNGTWCQCLKEATIKILKIF